MTTVTAATDVRGDRTSVLRLLARPANDADRRRARLVSIAVAGSGAFLLGAIAILAVHGDTDGGTPGAESMDENGNMIVNAQPSAALLKLAPYLSQSGLRPGTTFGAVLLVIPFVLFGLQALRTGTAARERRLAALSLAGAGRSQLRRLAFLEGTRAAALGALLAGPAYLALWVVLGVLLPDGAKLLPVPGAAVAIGWPVLIVVLTLAGGIGASLAAMPATVSPLGMTRRRPPDLMLAKASLPILLIMLAMVICAALNIFSTGVLLGLSLIGAIALLVISGPRMILLTGRFAVRDSRSLVSVLAGRRLLADVRSPGRVACVLFVVGVAFGVTAAGIADLLADPNYVGGDISFYVWGYVAAAVGAGVACLVTGSSLVVGATEQVLDGRRGTAALVALAASPGFVYAVVRRQLLLAAVPAALFGTVAGWLAGTVLLSTAGVGPVVTNAVIALPFALAGSGLLAALGASIAARAVRPAIWASSTPDNLRAP